MVGFHHRVARKLTGYQLQKVLDGMWVYPPLAEVKAEACLHEVETYVSLHQNTVAQFIVTGPILELFLAAERIPGPMISNRFW